MLDRHASASPAHDVLDAYGDRTVSMIRTRYEAKATARFGAACEGVLQDEIYEVTRRRFSAGKWLEREDVRRMERLYRQVFEGASFVLDAKDEERLPTRVKPRSWGVFLSRLHGHTSPEGTTRLAASVFTASRKHASYQVRICLHSWTAHAQERMHERTPRAVRADREIGSAIMEHYGLLSFLRDTTVPEGRTRFAVACGEGLLCGAFEDVPRSAPFASFCRSDRFGGLAASETVGDRLDSYEGEGTDPFLGFKALTYVGPDEMWPNQFEYLRRLADVNGLFRPYADGQKRVLLCSGIDYVMAREANMTEVARRYETTETGPGPDAELALKRLMADPDMRRAMGG